MNVSLAFTRLFFLILSILFMTTFMVAHPDGSWLWNSGLGVIIGFGFMIVLIAFDTLFRRFNLRAFNTTILGLFLGYLMGLALVLIFDAVLNLSTVISTVHSTTIELVKIALFLFGTYIGAIMTLRSADELYISIPFVKFAAEAEKKKDLIIDSSVLADARILDLCSTGILDHHIVVPRFILKELYAQAETGDENTKNRARRSLETLKKMENIEELGIRFNDTDFPEVKDPTSKLIRLARLVESNLLTADITRVQMATIEGVRIINIHSLSNALKPLMEAGEYITIKVQRYGKEPNQGVGYLEDGTMVVINGGGDFIGETIDAQVLSVKHTSSGRMIFCNAYEDEHHEEHDHD